jgi:predicted transcriptional regulator
MTPSRSQTLDEIRAAFAALRAQVAALSEKLEALEAEEDDDDDLDANVAAGFAELDAGLGIPHEEVMEGLRVLIERHAPRLE